MKTLSDRILRWFRSREAYTTAICGIPVKIFPRAIGGTWEAPDGTRGFWSPTRGWAEWSAWICVSEIDA